MANIEIPKLGGRYLRADDFKSDAFRKDAFEREKFESDMSVGRSVDLESLERQLERRPIEEIASLIRALTYGEMIELAEGLWNTRPEGADISKDNLPGLLHRWSVSRV
jgi:hypothetical protein